MKIKFWGTRGSIPTPARDCMKYGGNTPCIEVMFPGSDELIILDAGTGIRKLGIDLMKRYDKINAHLFITHSHWDHIQGIPFFNPIYSDKNSFTIMGCASVNKYIDKSLHDLMNPPYFPVGMEALRAHIKFIDKCEGGLTIGHAKVSVCRVNHPGDAMAFKITEAGKTFVYMTDNELHSPMLNEVPYAQLVDFAQGADLLVHDAQYTPEEYLLKEGWGHSSYVDAVNFACDAQVKKLLLFHHEPEYNDLKIDGIIKHCRVLLKERGCAIACAGACEGAVWIV